MLITSEQSVSSTMRMRMFRGILLVTIGIFLTVIVLRSSTTLKYTSRQSRVNDLIVNEDNPTKKVFTITSDKLTTTISKPPLTAVKKGIELSVILPAHYMYLELLFMMFRITCESAERRHLGKCLYEKNNLLKNPSQVRIFVSLLSTNCAVTNRGGVNI